MYIYIYTFVLLLLYVYTRVYRLTEIIIESVGQK
jgi:hypothetical protein